MPMHWFVETESDKIPNFLHTRQKKNKVCHLALQKSPLLSAK